MGDESRFDVLVLPWVAAEMCCCVLCYFEFPKGLMASCPGYCIAVVQLKGDKGMYYRGQIMNSKDGMNSCTCFRVIVRER